MKFLHRIDGSECSTNGCVTVVHLHVSSMNGTDFDNVRVQLQELFSSLFSVALADTTTDDQYPERG